MPGSFPLDCRQNEGDSGLVRWEARGASPATWEIVIAIPKEHRGQSGSTQSVAGLLWVDPKVVGSWLVPFWKLGERGGFQSLEPLGNLNIEGELIEIGR